MRALSIALTIVKRMKRDFFTPFFAIIFPAFFLFVFAMAFGRSGPLGNQRFDIAVINRDEGVTANFGAGLDTLRLGAILLDVLESLSYSPSSNWIRSDSTLAPLLDADSLRARERTPSSKRSTENAVFNVADTLTEETAVKKVSSGDLDAVLIIPLGFSKAAMATAMENVMEKMFSGAVDKLSSADSGLFRQKPTASDIQEMIDGISRKIAEKQKKGGVSLSSVSLPSRKAPPVALILAGDPSRLSFSMASVVVNGVVDEFLKKISQTSLERAMDFSPIEITPPRELVSLKSSNIAVEGRTFFDYQVPGVIVFALLMLVSLMAVNFSSDAAHGHLERLRLTRMSAFDYFLGNMMPWAILAIVQLFLLFGAGRLLGYHGRGNILSAIGIVVLTSLSSISLALIIASVAKNEKQASAVSTLIAVPLSFLSGAFFPIGDVVIAKNVFGKPFGIMELSPWTHGTKALVGVLTFGKSAHEVLWHVAWQVALTFVLFLIGISLFSKRRLEA
ncbi:MAG: ABC transporter permease [Candidatus Eisenbacteria bacterium]|nr:ABC transporter permease [Candidatus Eisenbacteria bacterium]